MNFEQHLADVLALAAPLPAVPASVDSSLLGRVLAAPVHAALPIPPLSNSAMDGFLVNPLDAQAVPCTLPVTGDIPAGAPPQAPAPGTALRIMTGAPVPEGFNGLVIPVEYTDVPQGPHPLPATVTIRELPSRDNIRVRGEHLALGAEALTSGTLVDAGALAALISAGATTVMAHPRPRVAVVSSGDELAMPGATLAPGHIPDSNGPMLEALAAPMAHVTHHHCGDDPAQLAALLAHLAAGHDLIVTTGGVSAGAFDVVHATLTTAPEVTNAWFGHVAHRPGGPQGHALWGGTPVLCLPGNPVAAFVSWHLYARRVVAKQRGLCSDLPRVRLTAAADFPPVRPGTTYFVPVRVSWAEATAVPFHQRQLASHIVASLAGTHGIAALRQGVSAGEPVTVYLY